MYVHFSLFKTLFVYRYMCVGEGATRGVISPKQITTDVVSSYILFALHSSFNLYHFLRRRINLKTIGVSLTGSHAKNYHSCHHHHHHHHHGAPPWSSGSVLHHRSLPPVFESRRGHIWRLFRLSLRLITFGGRSAHLAYLVHKSGRKTSIII